MLLGLGLPAVGFFVAFFPHVLFKRTSQGAKQRIFLCYTYLYLSMHFVRGEPFLSFVLYSIIFFPWDTANNFFFLPFNFQHTQIQNVRPRRLVEWVGGFWKMSWCTTSRFRFFIYLLLLLLFFCFPPHLDERQTRELRVCTLWKKGGSATGTFSHILFFFFHFFLLHPFHPTWAVS